MTRRRLDAPGASAVGLLAAGLLILGNVLLDPRLFWAGVATLTALTSGTTAWLLGRRTPFRTLAWVEALAAVESAGAAGLFLFLGPETTFSTPWFWAAAALGVGAWWWGRGRSRRRHPEAWRRWRTVAGQTGFLGYLTFRHIPADLSEGAEE